MTPSRCKGERGLLKACVFSDRDGLEEPASGVVSETSVLARSLGEECGGDCSSPSEPERWLASREMHLYYVLNPF